MATTEVRWIQRFNNYSKALGQLTRFLQQDELNDLEKQGLIQAFEYTFELAWNTIKDFFEAQGETGILGSRDAFRLAFNRGLIANGETWMDMITSRTLTSHSYNEETAERIALSVRTQYFGEFVALHARLATLKQEQEWQSDSD